MIFSLPSLAIAIAIIGQALCLYIAFNIRQTDTSRP
jgi:hypothetical protein